MSEYVNISFKKELADIIRKFIQNNPNFGYRSITQFIEDAARKRCEELKILAPKSFPALEHFNIFEDHVTVIDHRRKWLADVYFRNNHVYCESCENTNCEHVKYALTLPKVREILLNKGWIVTDDGKLKRKPIY